MPGRQLVSIVIPAYRRAGAIAACLDSLRAQSHDAWEALVVDDGSHDGTTEAVERYAAGEPRVRLLRHAANRGAQAARNTGVRAARGAWIALLDSDDRYLPDSLAVRLDAARSAGVDVVHSGCLVLTAEGEERDYRVPPIQGRVYPRLLQGEGPMFQGLLVRAGALARIGLLDEAIVAFQEWETAIRLARHFAFGFVPAATFVYDCRGGDTMSKDRRRGGRGYEQIVRKHFLPMLWHGGPATISRHFRIAAEWYETGGDMAGAGRCRRRARAWAALHPPTAWQRLRRLSAPGQGWQW